MKALSAVLLAATAVFVMGLYDNGIYQPIFSVIAIFFAKDEPKIDKWRNRACLSAICMNAAMATEGILYLSGLIGTGYIFPGLWLK